MRGAEAHHSGEGSREASLTAALEEGMTATVRDIALASPGLTAVAGGAAEVHRMLDTIENVWIDALGRRIHLDLHPRDEPKATVVFQPGSGAHARLYFLLGGLLARRGYQFLGVDRPGHGLSDGPRGDCTVEEAIAVADAVMAHARSRWGHPVVLMGSSMGGLLTMFALLHGLQPDAAVAHNFLYPGKLVSLRLRAVDRPLPRPPLPAGQAGARAGHAVRLSGGQRLDPRTRRSGDGMGAERPQCRELVRLPRPLPRSRAALPRAQR